MSYFIIIVSCILWAVSLWILFSRIYWAPILSFAALAILSMAETKEGYQIFPINTTILLGWFIMSAIVTVATMLQSKSINKQTLGMPYICIGAMVGMILGLLGITITHEPAMLYSIMIIATTGGIVFGYLLFTRTPKGEGLAPESGNFFRYLLAKGFPTAITVMQIGIACIFMLDFRHIY